MNIGGIKMRTVNNVKQKPFVGDILFAKETIKTLEDTIYEYYPKKYFDVLPLLHKAYDSLSMAVYRLEK